MSDGVAGGLLLMLALFVVPLLFAGFVALLALPLIAEHDPDVLFGGESSKLTDVPIKVAIAGALLAMCGGFFFAWTFVGELSLGWLFLAWVFWAPAFRPRVRRLDWGKGRRSHATPVRAARTCCVVAHAFIKQHRTHETHRHC